MSDRKPMLQIVRGLPGSGKTTLAVERYYNLLRLETDMFFTRGGTYTFTMELNEKAVKWFGEAVRAVADTGMDFVVTGVFTAHTERLGDVIEVGLSHGYDVWVKTLTEDHGSVHGVPNEHLTAMAESFVTDNELERIFAPKGVKFGLMPQTSR